VSHENVEILRVFFETWDPREWVRGENMSLFDPEVVYEGDVLPDQAAESYRKPQGIARAAGQWLEPFEEMTIELERIIGTGDCLVSVQRGSGRMRHTGMRFDRVYALLWRFRDGRVTYLKAFGDTGEALRAAKLEE
jgi:ketosteroid isomerase-like protein